VFILSASLTFFAADIPAAIPNADPTYQQLRNLMLGAESVNVTNFDLKRNAGTFHLRSGTVCFVAPVQGKVTGAVFTGDGNFVLDPPSASEKSMLKLLTKEDAFSENFSQMVLRFTDSTYDEIKKAGSAGAGGCDAGLLKDSQNTTRQKLKDNLEARLLEDLLSPEPGGLFVAFIHGKKYNDKELFKIDPHSSLEQVEFRTYDENKYGVWAAFPLGTVRRNRIHIEHQQLDTAIEKSANLSGKAVTTFVSEINGLRVVPLDLFRTLRVDSVTADGQGVPFIQEDKNYDADFFVILPKPLAAGEKCTLTTSYTGKEAVLNEGSGNYYPNGYARDNWYPNNANSAGKEYSAYDMTFRIPKGMKIAATGSMVSNTNDGGQNVTVWKSDAPQTLAGFNFGRFKVEEAKLTKPEYLVQSLANEDPPDWVKSLLHAENGDEALPTLHDAQSLAPQRAMGTMSTTGMIKHALAEAQLSV
jgi:hypothetical protein